MSGRYSVTCSLCTYQRAFSAPPAVYVLQDGTDMPIDEGMAWCHGCRDVTQSENLPLLADVERLLVRAQGDGQDLLVRELTRTRDWLTARVSPPRCLNCGCVQIEQFLPGSSIYRDEESDVDFHDISHPGCNGTLHVESVGLSLFRGWAAQYSSEGERVGDA